MIEDHEQASIERDLANEQLKKSKMKNILLKREFGMLDSKVNTLLKNLE